MKKLLFVFTLIAIMLFVGCSKDEEEEMKDVKMGFYAYTKYEPTSVPTKNSAEFFFFDANNGEKFKEERIDIPSGDWMDYRDTACGMIELLRHNELELIDGTRVKPVVIDGGYSISILLELNNPDSWNSLLSQNIVEIPKGKYYVVALLGRTSGWALQDKYSGKYIDVNESMIEDDKVITINFPHDGKRKGFIDWITTSWVNN